MSVGASVNGGVVDDMVSGSHVDIDGGTDGGHSGGEGDGALAFFAKGESFFEEARAGLIESVVDVDGGCGSAVDFWVGELLKALGSAFG